MFFRRLINITEAIVNIEKLYPLMMVPAASSLRVLSAGSFEAQCGKCRRFSHPVDAVGREHAWSELLREGWTWYTSPLGGTGYASCIECLTHSAPGPRGRSS
jgi:hypothetical protein